MEVRNANSAVKPLFWFPEEVNAHVIRVTGVFTFFAAAKGAGQWAKYVAYSIVMEFVLRFLGGAKFSILGNLAFILTYPWEPKPRYGGLKQFAACCVSAFSSLGSLFFLVPFPCHDIVAAVFMGMLAVACGMEGCLDFCLGCVFFKMGIKLGLIPNERGTLNA
jgi:hypothetical protein